MKIVSDTGPIIGLAKIGKIILLKNIADEVIIPPMVYKELFGKIGPESNEIDQALNTFIMVKIISEWQFSSSKTAQGIQNFW
jgi:predicted nucleic acid-binding protein